MNLKTRILGVSAGVALAVGLAGPAFAGAPVVSTGETAYDQGSMSSRGSCSTIAIGTILDAAKLNGLGATEQALTSSSKGYARNSTDAAALRVGECAVRTSAGFSGGTATGFGDYVIKYVAKFGTKLTSTATDCNSTEADTPDTDERPLAGKMSIGFTDLTKTDAYIRVQGFDTEAADKVWLTGIVAKGEGVGATIGGNVWFNPAYKAKGATGLFYGDTVVDDVKTTTIDESALYGDASKVIASGYATSVLFTIGEAVGCSDGGVTPIGASYGVPGL
ncbi:MAG: hypothetical protein RL531_1941, partial [Actinomycetota bacterium]